jgi:ATP-dependent DNA helicase DinG
VIVERSTLSVDDIFALLAENLDGYEVRSQQLELSHLIERSLRDEETGFFEAGTGIGKSLAALVPAILSGKKVVVSTATIALQEQYINKDIPTLQKLVPFEFQAALIKGRGNYLSTRRLEDHLLEFEIDERLVDWVHDTAFGDMSELDFVPGMETWLEVNSDPDDCLRNKCPHFNDCFYFEARRRAEKADVIVVNHALLLADAASAGSILPAYEYLIVDEAQHLPAIAIDAFSAGISNRGLRILGSKANKKVGAPLPLVHEIEQEGAEFFDRLGASFSSTRMRLRQSIDSAEHLQTYLEHLKQWLEEQDFAHMLDVDMSREKAKLKAKSLLTTVNNYLHCLELLANPDRNWVVWAEKSERQTDKLEIVAAPLNVAELLQNTLFAMPALRSSIWMSATLATAGRDPFQYFKSLIGCDHDVVQQKISSPFDYKKQAALYLPDFLPEPNHPQFAEAAAKEIARILQVSSGRAFVLFTSYTAMNNVFGLLWQDLPYPLKRQGEMPRQKLIEWFRATPQAVLFGTSSFWEGVSIDGDQLSCVIIDRIPFQVPDDPVYEARCEALQNDGEGSWFNELALPHAIMRLKQGVGRLIRTKSDSGVVAILDPRLSRKQYGRAIIDSLPPMKRIKSINGVASIEDLLAR